MSASLGLTNVKLFSFKPETKLISLISKIGPVDLFQLMPEMLIGAQDITTTVDIMVKDAFLLFL